VKLYFEVCEYIRPSKTQRKIDKTQSDALDRHVTYVTVLCE